MAGEPQESPLAGKNPHGRENTCLGGAVAFVRLRAAPVGPKGIVLIIAGSSSFPFLRCCPHAPRDLRLALALPQPGDQ